jgi:outer membrane protein assembly factor BamB
LFTTQLFKIQQASGSKKTHKPHDDYTSQTLQAQLMKSVILFFLLFVTRLVSGSLSLLNSFDLGVSIEDCQPWVENDVIYIGALNGTLYAINFTTGSLIWSAQLNEPVSVDQLTSSDI